MTTSDLPDKRERLERLRCLIAALSRDIATQEMPAQVRAEANERVARWTQQADAMRREIGE